MKSGKMYFLLVTSRGGRYILRGANHETGSWVVDEKEYVLDCRGDGDV